MFIVFLNEHIYRGGTQTGAILCIANLLCAASKDLAQQVLAQPRVVDAVVAAAGVRPRNRVAWRKHATATAKALEVSSLPPAQLTPRALKQHSECAMERAFGRSSRR